MRTRACKWRSLTGNPVVRHRRGGTECLYEPAGSGNASERVGDNRTMKVDVRIIAATNLDLQEEVAKGTFREDLFYRLNVVTIHLPALRNRREDVPRLIDFFLDKFNAENAKQLRKISKEMLNVLVRYQWPGNVRELENAIERAVVLSRSDTLTEDLLPTAIRAFAQQGRANMASEGIDTLTRRLAEQSINEFELREGQIYDMVIRQVEKALIERALSRCAGVKIKAADFLGINRNTLNKKFKEEFPNETQYRHTLAEEVDALNSVILSAKGQKVAEDKMDNNLRQLIALQKDGMLESWVLLNNADQGILQDYPAYRDKHRDVLHAYIEKYVLRPAEK